MDALLLQQIIDALQKGDWQRFCGYVFISYMVWREIHKLTKGFVRLETKISENTLAGDIRFNKIEQKQNDFEQELFELKNHNQGV